MAGRVCLVTGATSGHGLAVARGLARRGAELILLGRDPARCAHAQQQIAALGASRPRILLCDLSSRAAIEDAAAELLASGTPLHVLVNNAGLVNAHRRETSDGLEETFAVNYLAYYRLTLLLLPRLRASAPARIINVTSETHRVVRLDLDDLQHRRRPYGLLRAYARSKLAIVYFTLELDRRLAGSGVTVNAVDPGPVASRIGQNNPGLAARAAGMLIERLFPSPERAARQTLELASAPQLASVSGGYYSYGRRRRPRAPGGPQLGARLWQISAELSGVDLPARQ